MFPVESYLAIVAMRIYDGIGGLRAGWLQCLEKLQKQNDDTFKTEICSKILSKFTLQVLKPEVVAAWDVNENANTVYSYVWGRQPSNLDLSRLRLNQCDGKADCWLLSPPCQPYTRGECENPPTFVLLENVPGFELSSSRNEFLSALTAKGFNYRELIASPTQIGIPNTRVRYYLIAWREATQLDVSVPGIGSARNEGKETAVTAVEEVKSIENDRKNDFSKLQSETSLSGAQQLGRALSRPGQHLFHTLSQDVVDLFTPPPKQQNFSAILSERLDNFGSRIWHEEPYEALFIKSSTLQRPPGTRFDVVNSSTYGSTTVTKAYGKLVLKSGPIVVVEETGRAERCIRSIRNSSTNDGSRTNTARHRDSPPFMGCIDDSAMAWDRNPQNVLQHHYNTPLADHPLREHLVDTRLLCPERFTELSPDLQFRWLSPNELLRLHGFPNSFKFPAKVISRLQAYALIGNSVNVTVVAAVVMELLMAAADTSKSHGLQPIPFPLN